MEFTMHLPCCLAQTISAFDKRERKKKTDKLRKQQQRWGTERRERRKNLFLFSTGSRTSWEASHTQKNLKYKTLKYIRQRLPTFWNAATLCAPAERIRCGEPVGTRDRRDKSGTWKSRLPSAPAHLRTTREHYAAYLHVPETQQASCLCAIVHTGLRKPEFLNKRMALNMKKAALRYITFLSSFSIFL